MKHYETIKTEDTQGFHIVFSVAHEDTHPRDLFDTTCLGLNQANLVNETYVMEDGTIQNWVGNGLNKAEVKKQIMDRIQQLKNKINS